MKSIIATSIALGTTAAMAYVQGFDISHYQPNVNFGGAYGSGARFVMIKATEGTGYVDPSFNSHYVDATNAGFIRGGYHFAHPNQDASAQADHFVAHGGGWSGDGITLPGMLDMETGSASGSSQCWGISHSAMVSWIKEFSNRYESKVGRPPMIYTSPSWWKSCTGDSHAFHNNPLVEAKWSSTLGSAPGGWPYASFWQNANHYSYGGDSERWNGSGANLKKFARG